MKKTITIAVMAFAIMSTTVQAEIFSNSFSEAKIENYKPIEGLSIFCNAILKGELETVKSMIALGENVNEKSLGMTPAIFAARYNKAEILKVLIANGADLSVRCDKGLSINKHAEMANAKDALMVINKYWEKNQ